MLRAEIEAKLYNLMREFVESLDPGQFDVFVRPLANATGIGDSSSNTDVLERIQRLLREEQIISLLMVGDGGMGKTLISQYVVNQMWEHYQAGEWIPVYLYLASCRAKAASSLENDLLESFFEKHGFTFEEIRELKAEGKLLVILDGYDELKFQDNRPLNIYKCHRFGEWQHLRLIITSREENLLTYSHQENIAYPVWFYPESTGQFTERDRFSELHLCVFNADQRKDYLQQYVRTREREPRENAAALTAVAPDWSNWETYEHYLTTLSGLLALIETPVILHMVVAVLPEIIAFHAEESDLKQLRFTRTKIYEHFVNSYFERQLKRLNSEGKLTHLSDEQKRRYLWRYAENLASWVWQDGQGKFVELLIPEEKTRDANLFQLSRAELQRRAQTGIDLAEGEARLVEADYLDIRAGCLLRTYGGCFRFLHKSLVEFFAARELFQGVMTMMEYASVLRKKAAAIEEAGGAAGEAVQELIAEEVAEAASPASPETEALAETFHFNSHLINAEPSIVRLLAEQATEDPEFRSGLLEIVGYSRHDESVATAAANAMTVLNYAQTCFTEIGLDNIKGNFVGVKIPGADLSRGLLAETDFSGAILRDIKFYGAILTNVRFVGADLTGAEFGLEQRLVPEKLTIGLERYLFAFFSNDGKYLFAYGISEGMRHGAKSFINVIEIVTGKIMRQLNLANMNGIRFLWRRKHNKFKLGDEIIFTEAFMATTTMGNEIKIFDTSNWQCIATISCRDGREIPFTVSPKEFLRSAAITRIDTIQVASQELNMTFTPEGYLLIAEAFPGYIIVFNPRDRKIIDLIGKYEGEVTELVCNVDGRLLAINRRYSILVWDIKNRCPITTLHENQGAVTTIAFGTGQNSYLLASGDVNQTVKIWDVTTGTEVVAFSASDTIRDVVFSPDGLLLIAASDDQLLRSWDIKEQALISIQTCGAAATMNLTFNPNGSLLAFATIEGLIIKNSLTLQKAVIPRQFCYLGKQHVEFSPNGQLIAVFSEKEIRVITWRQEQKISLTTSEEEKITCVIFMDNNLLVTGNNQGEIQIWDIEQSCQLTEIITEHVKIIGLGFNSCGQQLIVIRQARAAREKSLEISKLQRQIEQLIKEEESLEGKVKETRLLLEQEKLELEPKQNLDTEQAQKALDEVNSKINLLTTTAETTKNRLEELMEEVRKDLVDDYYVETWDMHNLQKICQLSSFSKKIPNFGNTFADAKWFIYYGFIIGMENPALNSIFHDSWGEVLDGLDSFSVIIINIQTQQFWLLKRGFFNPFIGFVKWLENLDKTMGTWQNELFGQVAAINLDNLLAIASSDLITMQLWDLEKQKKITALDGGQGLIYGADFSTDGKLLAVLGTDKIIVWNLSNRAFSQVPTNLPFKKLKFIAETTFVAVDFYLGYSEWRVNIHPDGKLSIYPMLRTQCLATETECRGLNLDHAKGDFSERDLMLFKQHEVVGEMRIRETKRFLLWATNDIPVKTWVEMRLTADAARPVDSCFSLVDAGIQLSYNTWAVSIVRCPESKYPDHGTLLVEGLDIYGKAIMWKMHYTVEKTGASGSEGSSALTISAKGAVLGTYEFDIATDVAARQEKILELFRHDIGHRVNYLSWGITRKQALQLLEDVMQDQFNPPRYFLYSGVAFWRRAPDTNEHNCFTWARAKLMKLKDSAIVLPESPRDIMHSMREKTWDAAAITHCSVM